MRRYSSVALNVQELLSLIGALVRGLTFDETHDLAVLDPSGHRFAVGISGLGIDTRGSLVDCLQHTLREWSGPRYRREGVRPGAEDTIGRGTIVVGDLVYK